MTDTERAEHFIVRWHGGLKDIQLCPDPFVERLYARDSEDRPGWDLKQPEPVQVGRRQRILDAVPTDRWVTSYTVAQRVGELMSSNVPGELHTLYTQGKLRRQRPEGRWVYQRVPS